jgi:hypothetical protein
MPTAVSRATAVLIAAGLSGIAAAALAGPATAAAAPAALTFLPAKGLASTPMTMVIPAACPAAGSNVVAKAFGHGFPAQGQTVVTNSTAGVSHNAPFALPLQDTFTGFAADNGTKLSGAYLVTLRCISRLGNKTYASYTGTITFSDSSHFTAPAPSDALVNQIQQAEQPQVPVPTSAGPKAKGKQGPASGASANPGQSTGAGAGGTGGTAAGGTTAGVAPSSAAKSTKPGFPWEPTLIVAAFVLIGLGILLRIRELRQSNRRKQSRLKQSSTATTHSAEKPSKSSTLTGSGTSNHRAKGNDS